MKHNIFDQVMDYIDVNIHKESEVIKKGIYKVIGYNSNTFGSYFKLLTGISLSHYITRRKLYYAAWSLQNEVERPIVDIAIECGYSEQSAMTRAFRTYYDTTPNDIRLNKVSIPNEKYRLSDLCDNSEGKDARIKKILRGLNDTGNLSNANWSYFFELEDANQEFEFDNDTLYKISELAEALEVPASELMKLCYDLQIDIQSDPEYISPDVEIAIDCGIKSDEELKMICDFYNCKYYDLDRFMVENFRKQRKRSHNCKN